MKFIYKEVKSIFFVINITIVIFLIMDYKVFGQKSGVHVSTLAPGTGNFGTVWPFGASKEAKTVFDRYAEARGNYIDTADAYQGGRSETYPGDVLTSERDNFVIPSLPSSAPVI
ncbi:aldo/keto reductase [Dyadobacter koreensis]|uniref:aldo/keto reductase n=1 Tax=Dyadobacter koreensis TaxID=408657 RepID=UPI000B829311|nr:aldo/keto reductase [Dyadobacter koreensis]